MGSSRPITSNCGPWLSWRAVTSVSEFCTFSWGIQVSRCLHWDWLGRQLDPQGVRKSKWGDGPPRWAPARGAPVAAKGGGECATLPGKPRFSHGSWQPADQEVPSWAQPPWPGSEAQSCVKSRRRARWLTGACWKPRSFVYSAPRIPAKREIHPCIPLGRGLNPGSQVTSFWGPTPTVPHKWHHSEAPLTQPLTSDVILRPHSHSTSQVTSFWSPTPTAPHKWHHSK